VLNRRIRLHPHGCRFYSVTITAAAPVTVKSTSATTTATAAKSAPAAAARRAILPRTSFVDRQSSPVNLTAVERRNRRFCGFPRIHFNKGEYARTARVTVCYQIG
jgi:hypothetical protein